MKMFCKKVAIDTGFTLIEILVAVTILAMIFAIIFGTFFYMIQNTEKQEERAQIYQRASFILNNISQNVASAYIPFLRKSVSEETDTTDITDTIEDSEPPVFLGTTAEDENEPVDSLSLFTANPRFAAPTLAGEIASVAYSVAEEEDNDDSLSITDQNNPIALTCTVAPVITGGTAEDGSFLWTMNITSLKLEYFDGEEWTSEWSYEEQDALPAAVKVALAIADSEGNPHTFSTVAAIPVNTPLHETEVGSTEEEQQEEEQEREEELESETLPDEGEHPEGRQDLPPEEDRHDIQQEAPQPSTN
jgi:prepilin-type N-terminal cleavage/methylation domain-containing protein